MSSLRDTQRWLARAILTPERLACDPSIEATLRRCAGGDVLERLRTYTRGYPARVHEALTEAFPAVRHVLGATEFEALARRYLPRAPAGNYNLAHVGANLPGFVATDPLGTTLPFLPDLALLEWYVQRAFHAHLAVPLDTAPLAVWSIDRWHGARVRFQEGVALLRSRWPVWAIWEARKTARAAIDVELDGRADRVLVYRTDYRVACESVDEAEAKALDRLLAGAILGAVLADVSGTAAAKAAGWLVGWFRRGLLTAIEAD